MLVALHNGQEYERWLLKASWKIFSNTSQSRDKKAYRDAFIFPELHQLEHIEDKFQLKKTISFATGRIDKILRKGVAPEATIDKRLTMHYDIK